MSNKSIINHQYHFCLDYLKFTPSSFFVYINLLLGVLVVTRGSMYRVMNCDSKTSMLPVQSLDQVDQQ